MRRLINGLLIASGALCSITGVSFVGIYVYSGIIERLGEPDQSLAFWYLPILMIGVVLLGGGVALCFAGVQRRRRDR